MADLPAAIVAWHEPPEGLDRIAAELRAMRHEAGSPSYGEIARRIGAARAARGASEHEQVVPRTTVYDCFREGRRRVDVVVVVEIAAALGLPARVLRDWAARVRLARASADGASVITSRADVPRPVPTFTGREAAIALAEQALAPDDARVWIDGLGGIGKTQLALALADRAGCGGFFLDLRGFRAEAGVVEVAAAQRAILRMRGVDDPRTDDESERAAAVAEALAGAARLLLLDDAPSAGYVERILGTGSAGRVIVTSRALPDRDGWERVPLTGLSASESADLLARLASAPVSGDDADRIVEVTEGLPLAVALLGGRVASHAGWSLGEHLDLVETRTRRGHVEQELDVTLSASVDALPADAQRLLRAFADLPVPELDAESAAALLDIETRRAGELCGLLVARSLAIDRGDAGIALHALVRAFARERAETTDSPRERSAAFARLGWFSADRVWAAYETLAREAQGDPPRRTTFTWTRREWSREEAERWLAEHLPSVLAVAHAAPDRGHPEILFRISEGAAWWLLASGLHREAILLHETAADVAVEERDADALAMASLDAGKVLVYSSRVDEIREHAQRAMWLVDDAGSLSDPGLMGVILNMLALVDVRQGRFDDAAESLRRAAVIHEEHGETSRLLATLINLGVALHGPGRFAEEREVNDRALGLARETESRDMEANLLTNRIEILTELGDPAAALATGGEALAAAEEAGVAMTAPYAYGASAEAARRLGDLPQARSLADRAVAAARAGSDIVGLADILIVDAAVAADEGRADHASSLLDEAGSLLAAGSDPVLRGRIKQLRGDLATDRDERVTWWRRALASFGEAGSYHAERVRHRLEAEPAD